jgi:hypothetical protein
VRLLAARSPTTPFGRRRSAVGDSHESGRTRIVIGWAEGDLLAGDTLLDCKTTIHPTPLPRECIYQLIAYALLNSTDFYSAAAGSTWLSGA